MAGEQPGSEEDADAPEGAQPRLPPSRPASPLRAPSGAPAGGGQAQQHHSNLVLRGAAELAQPALSPIAAGQPVALVVPWVPPGGMHPSLRHPASGAAASKPRAGTAVSCSLPGSELFRVTSMLGPPPASPPRPATAPGRRQAAQAPAGSCPPNQAQQQARAQQQLVSRRSLAGQQWAAAGGAARPPRPAA
jgi:hypothetical protein